jgi:type VI secretion system protein ImpH
MQTSPAELLFREPCRFDFFQAVRLLERLAQEEALRDPRRRREPVGQDGTPEREVVRFRAQPALGFPFSEVSDLRTSRDGEVPPEMVVTFLGLFGPSGALPLHYTSLLLRRLRLRDTSLRDFLDLFNHRLVSLFYRAWEKYRLPFAYERAGLDPTRPGKDLCTEALYNLVGMGTPHLRGSLEIDDEAFLYYSGHFAHFPRTASALEALLGDYFGVPVQVLQFQGQWLLLSQEDRSCLPSRGHPQGRNNALGIDAIAGKRVWDVQGKFRLRVGPLSYPEFRRLLPNGFGLRPLCQLTRSYVGADLDFDVQLVLRQEEVPRARLAARGSERSHLGWNAWLRTRPPVRDADQAIFSADAARLG